MENINISPASELVYTYKFYKLESTALIYEPPRLPFFHTIQSRIDSVLQSAPVYRSADYIRKEPQLNSTLSLIDKNLWDQYISDLATTLLSYYEFDVRGNELISHVTKTLLEMAAGSSSLIFKRISLLYKYSKTKEREDRDNIISILVYITAYNVPFKVENLSGKTTNQFTSSFYEEVFRCLREHLLDIIAVGERSGYVNWISCYEKIANKTNQYNRCLELLKCFLVATDCSNDIGNFSGILYEQKSKKTLVHVLEKLVSEDCPFIQDVVLEYLYHSFDRQEAENDEVTWFIQYLDTADISMSKRCFLLNVLTNEANEDLIEDFLVSLGSTIRPPMYYKFLFDPEADYTESNTSVALLYNYIRVEFKNAYTLSVIFSDIHGISVDPSKRIPTIHHYAKEYYFTWKLYNTLKSIIFEDEFVTEDLSLLLEQCSDYIGSLDKIPLQSLFRRFISRDNIMDEFSKQYYLSCI